MRSLALLQMLLCAACGGSPAGPGPGGTGSIGLMLAAPGLTIAQEVDLARSLGATWFRPSSAVFLDRSPVSCAGCLEATRAGMKLVLSVSTGRSDFSPAQPPADLAVYRAGVADVLRRLRPAVLSVENEENSGVFYGGSPEEYGTELRAACEVAHAQRVACTNGGLVSTLVALLVYRDYLDAGDQARAEDFAGRAFTAAQRQLLGSAAALDQLDRGRRLIRQYRTSDIDYVNFHWYSPDAQALAEAVTYLRRATGKPPITNEIGQHDREASTVTTLLGKAVQLNLPIVVWYSVDSPQAFGLTEGDGSLRPAGEAFRAFVRGAFSQGPTNTTFTMSRAEAAKAAPPAGEPPAAEKKH